MSKNCWSQSCSRYVFLAKTADMCPPPPAGKDGLSISGEIGLFRSPEKFLAEAMTKGHPLVSTTFYVALLLVMCRIVVLVFSLGVFGAALFHDARGVCCMAPLVFCMVKPVCFVQKRHAQFCAFFAKKCAYFHGLPRSKFLSLTLTCSF